VNYCGLFGLAHVLKCGYEIDGRLCSSALNRIRFSSDSEFNTLAIGIVYIGRTNDCSSYLTENGFPSETWRKLRSVAKEDQPTLIKVNEEDPDLMHISSYVDAICIIKDKTKRMSLISWVFTMLDIDFQYIY
jgi:hypothetical protein